MEEKEPNTSARLENWPGCFLKILHVVGDLSLESGGLAVAVRGLAAAQAQLGHQASILSTDYKWTGSDRKVNGMELHFSACEWPLWRWSGEFNRLALTLIECADIVHLHALWDYPVLAAARICKKLNKPFVLTAHGMMDRWSMAQKSWKKKFYLKFVAPPILQGARAIHFTSDQERECSRLENFHGKIFVSAFGIPDSAMEQLPSALALGQRFPDLKSRRIILFLGRLHYKKNPDVLIDAFAKITGEHPDVCLVIVGSGDKSYVSGLYNRVSRLKLNQSVYFKGMLNRDAVQEAYRAAEIFVSPSFQENFGFSIMEAMASGCPVVVGETVDYASQIAQNRAGLLCSPTPKSVAEALETLLQNPTLRREMGQRGRQFVIEGFGWPAAANRFIAFYESLLQSSY